MGVIDDGKRKIRCESVMKTLKREETFIGQYHDGALAPVDRAPVR